MVLAISDCPGTEQNINIKGTICNFKKVGVWVQVLSRVALNARKQKFGYINNSLRLARKYARIFVLGHYLFRVALGKLFATRNR